MKLLETVAEDLNKVNHRPVNTIIETVKTSVKKATTITQRMIFENEHENQLSHIIKELKNFVMNPKTYADAAATRTHRETTPNQETSPNRKNLLSPENDQIKQEREKQAFTITAKTAPNSTKKVPEIMHGKERIKRCGEYRPQVVKFNDSPVVNRNMADPGVVRVYLGDGQPELQGNCVVCPATKGVYYPHPADQLNVNSHPRPQCSQLGHTLAQVIGCSVHHGVRDQFGVCEWCNWEVTYRQWQNTIPLQNKNGYVAAEFE